MVTVLILMMLTVIGAAAITSSNTELKIATNEREYKKNFYIADGGMNKEFMLTPGYPITLTKAEQYTHNPYHIVYRGYNSTSLTPIDNNSSIAQGSIQSVGPTNYCYAVKFIERRQALQKGEGAAVDLLYYEIQTKVPDSVELRTQGFLRSIN